MPSPLVETVRNIRSGFGCDTLTYFDVMPWRRAPRVSPGRPKYGNVDVAALAQHGNRSRNTLE